MSDASSCRSCQAPIVWALTPKGEKHPVNTGVDREKGNVLLLQPSGFGNVLAVVLSKDALVIARRGGVQLRTSHWFTCPEKKEWRERTDAKREAAGASDRA